MSTQYRADIQGLRAIAVIPVVAFHAWPRLVPGGFVGVDIFFVISGFLITQIIMREVSEGQFHLSRFYARRAKRLVPALTVVLIGTLLAGLVLLPPKQLDEMSRSALSTIFFASNIYFMQNTDYFAQNVDLIPLLHTWSLAVEEQFYLFFPLLLLILTRFKTNKTMYAFILFAFFSLSMSIWLTKYHSKAAFYLPLSRSFELLCGAIVANLTIRLNRPAFANGLSIVGGIFVVAAYAFIDNTVAFPGFAMLVPSIGAALLVFSGAHGPTIFSRALSSRLLVYIGGISYSLYLWHWPILTYMRYYYLGQQSVDQITLALLIIAGVSWLSWRFIEMPTLRAKVSDKQVLSTAAVVLGVVAMMFSITVYTRGVPERFDIASKTLFASSNDANRLRDKCHAGLDTPIAYDASCSFGAAMVPSTAVWADSFGAELTVALGEIAAKRGRSVLEITSSLCPPSLDFTPLNRPGCTGHNSDTLKRLMADGRITTVVMAAGYLYYPFSRREALIQGFEAAVRALRHVGKQVVIVFPVPRQPFPAPLALGLAHKRAIPFEELGYESAQNMVDTNFFEARLQGLARATGAIEIHPSQFICGRTRCAPLIGNHVLYFDERHLSLTGARYVLQSARWSG